MPDFLPQGSYADAGKRLLEDYLEYIALLEDAESAEGGTERFYGENVAPGAHGK